MMWIVLSFIMGLFLALGLVFQVRAVVSRKRSFRGQLWKYVSLFGFLALFYYQEDVRTEIGLSYTLGAIVGVGLGIVAKQGRLR